jgi:secondary thiamine-phosphate synthase enzyme
MLRYIEVDSRNRTEFIDITGRVRELVAASGTLSGLCCLAVLHTTAGLTVNEGADPSVQRDMVAHLDRLVPAAGPYTHGEGNSDAHIKTALVGTSQMLPIDGGNLVLGTWQAIYLCEFDGPRRRRVAVRIMADS